MRNYNDLISLAEAFQYQYNSQRGAMSPHLAQANVAVIAMGNAALYQFMGVAAPESAKCTLHLVSIPDSMLLNNSRLTIGPQLHRGRPGLSIPRLLNSPHAINVEHRKFYHWMENGVCHAIGDPFAHSNFELVSYQLQRDLPVKAAALIHGPDFELYAKGGVIHTPDLMNIVMRAQRALPDTTNLSFQDLVYIIKSYEAAIDIKQKLGVPVSFSVQTANALNVLKKATGLYAELEKKVASSHLDTVAVLANPLKEAARIQTQARVSSQFATHTIKMKDNEIRKKDTEISDLRAREMALQAQLEAERGKAAEERLKSDQIETMKREMEALNAKLLKEKRSSDTQATLEQKIKTLSAEKNELSKQNEALSEELKKLDRTLGVKVEVQEKEIQSLNARVKRLLKEKSEKDKKSQELQKPVPVPAVPSVSTVAQSGLELSFDKVLTDLDEIVASLDEPNVTPSVPVNEFDIPDFGYKMIIVRLKEMLALDIKQQLLIEDFMDDVTYDRLKEVVISLEKNGELDALVARFKSSNFLRPQTNKESIVQDVNFYLKLTTLVMMCLDKFNDESALDGFYKATALLQRKFYASYDIDSYSNLEFEVSIHQQVEFLNDFYVSDFGKSISTQALSMRLTSILENQIPIALLIINKMLKLITDGKPGSKDFVEEFREASELMKNMHGAALDEHLRLAQTVQTYLSKSTLPWVGGPEGQIKFIESIYRFTEVLLLDKDEDPNTYYFVAWLSLNTVCLSVADLNFNRLEKRTSHVFTMLNILLAIAQVHREVFLPQVIENAKRVLDEHYNQDGTYKDNTGRFIEKIKEMTRFYLTHLELIRTAPEKRAMSRNADAYQAYIRIKGNESDEMINIMLECAQRLAARDLGYGAPSQDMMAGFISKAKESFESIEKEKQKVIIFSKSAESKPSPFASQVNQFVENNTKVIETFLLQVNASKGELKRMTDKNDELLYIQYNRLQRLFCGHGGQQALDNHCKSAYLTMLQSKRMISAFITQTQACDWIGQLMRSFSDAHVVMKTTVLDPWFKSLSSSETPDLAALFTRMHALKPRCCHSPEMELCFFLKCFQDPETGKYEEQFLIDQKVFAAITPLCDLEKQVSVENAISEFKKRNIFRLSKAELNDELAIRSVLNEVMVEFKAANSKLTANNHAYIDSVINDLKTTPKAGSSSSQRRK